MRSTGLARRDPSLFQTGSSLFRRPRPALPLLHPRRVLFCTSDPSSSCCACFGGRSSRSLGHDVDPGCSVLLPRLFPSTVPAALNDACPHPPSFPNGQCRSHQRRATGSSATRLASSKSRRTSTMERKRNGGHPTKPSAATEGSKFWNEPTDRFRISRLEGSTSACRSR